MAVVERRTSKGIKVYWVAFYFEGKQKWERSGTDERQAEALDRRRKREVASGTYAPEHTPTMPVSAWLKDWASKRTNRNAEDDRSLITRFLLSPEREWLGSLPIEDVRARHSNRLVQELKVTVSEETGKPLSEKYVSNIYGLFATSMHDARLAELLFVDPCVLKRGLLRRKARRGVRLPYDVEAIHKILRCPDLEARMLATIALFTGEREGEVCGQRWRDWDRHSSPLGCLSVLVQYDDRPLKSERGKGEHPRKVPVHPLLAQALDTWHREGFELVYCRKPTPSDRIVPRTMDGKPHTKSSAYKLWRRACRLSEVDNLSLHSTRHTFVTQCRRGGAPKDVVEQITHNAGGTIVDQYTHWEWGPLCDAVLCLKLPLDSNLDSTPKTSKKSVEAPGIEPGSENGLLALLRT
jgi:integrase